MVRNYFDYCLKFIKSEFNAVKAINLFSNYYSKILTKFKKILLAKRLLIIKMLSLIELDLSQHFSYFGLVLKQTSNRKHLNTGDRNHN